MVKIRETIEAHKGAKQESLIRLLNPIITGWANYYRYSVSSKTFRKADKLIFEKLWQWAQRRHPKRGSIGLLTSISTRLTTVMDFRGHSQQEKTRKYNRAETTVRHQNKAVCKNQRGCKPIRPAVEGIF